MDETQNEVREPMPQKSNAKVWVIIAIIVIVVAGIFYFSRGKGTPTYGPSSSSSTPTTPASPYGGSNTPNNQPSQMTAPTTTEPTAPTSAGAVTIQNFSFSPATLTIKKGETVTWTNQDSVPHQIASDTVGKFQGPAISQGQTYSFTFNETGTFPYHCAIHPMMKATITVQ